MPQLKTLVVSLSAVLLVGCLLPPPKDRPESSALPTDQARLTPIGQAIEPQRAAHPGKMGIYLLDDPTTTFGALTQLARNAQRTLDLQYYIWYDDGSGTLLLRELLNAAERGVRVRLLLDDQGTRKLDTELAALNDHPNMEVRLFNPFVARDARWLDFITRFERANRRMHNKAIIADNAALISGGRNIGNSYFGATEGFLFSDLGILAVGPIVDNMSAGFDDYWESPSAYPAEQILPPAPDGSLDQLYWDADAYSLDPDMQELLLAVRENFAVGSLLRGELGLIWAPAELVLDPPTKGLGPIALDKLLTIDLRDKLGVPRQSVDIISPFFIPTPTLTGDLVTLAKRGVRVRVLTNSLDATDMAPAHSGYARYRKPLLKAGVELYEVRRPTDRQPDAAEYGLFGSGSPATTLHAKAVVIDGRRVFIGSYNVDPRSVLLNTEVGFVIDSPKLASAISHTFEMHVPQSAYRVELEDGDLTWIEEHDEKVIRHEREPGAGPFKRATAWLFSVIPIEWLL